MDILGRYYTNQPVSELLVSKFRQDNPENILELGIGNGSLLHAAYRRWRNASFYGADIDRKSIAKISSHLPFVNLVHINGLSPGLPQKMKLKVGSIDVAVCNPPYRRMTFNLAIKSLFNEVGLVESLNLNKITSDIVFLAQNLRMLKDKGELGIILPDSIFTGHEFVYLREDILTNHKILALIQLPDNIFSRTEARTHILLMEKGSPADLTVPLYRSDSYGQLSPVINVSQNELLYRMDYTYYEWKRNQKVSNTSITLGKLGIEIKRGLKTKKDLQKLKVPFFHTTSFPRLLSSKVRLVNSSIQNGVIAQPGDILMARVGKRSIGRVTMVECGSQVISDCIYRLRGPRESEERVWHALISEQGQEWLNAHAHGVCSRVISKKDLLSFKIEL